jgi:hypothetical protein
MIYLNYIAHHTCGREAKRSDYRIKSREDLKREENLKPLKLRCHPCWLEIDATHFEIYEDERLGLKLIVGEMEVEKLGEVCRGLAEAQMGPKGTPQSLNP